MKVWIVFKNNEIDAVFDNEAAALNHKKNAIKGWSIVYIVEREVFSF